MTTSTPYAIITIEIRKGKVRIMLVKERTITIRTATVELDDYEIASLNDVRGLALCYLDLLNDNDAEQLYNPATGELIEKRDLMRLRGVLEGLIHCRHWEVE